MKFHSTVDKIGEAYAIETETNWSQVSIGSFQLVLENLAKGTREIGMSFMSRVWLAEEGGNHIKWYNIPEDLSIHNCQALAIKIQQTQKHWKSLVFNTEAEAKETLDNLYGYDVLWQMKNAT